MQAYLQSELNRVAETQFFLRPTLFNALRTFVLTDDTRADLSYPYANYAELWEGTYSDKFFDMSTMIRLGTVIEGGFKRYYMDKMEHSNIPQLLADPSYMQNIFQRVMPWQSPGAILLYNEKLSIDLTILPKLSSVQEAMLHRHLYAHNSGILDQKYIDDLKRLKGDDIAEDPSASTFPSRDTYWFEPLTRINQFIEDAREFFGSLP
jgi:hypothetical protein